MYQYFNKNVGKHKYYVRLFYVVHKSLINTHNFLKTKASTSALFIVLTSRLRRYLYIY